MLNILKGLRRRVYYKVAKLQERTDMEEFVSQFQTWR